MMRGARRRTSQHGVAFAVDAVESALRPAQLRQWLDVGRAAGRADGLCRVPPRRQRARQLAGRARLGLGIGVVPGPVGRRGAGPARALHHPQPLVHRLHLRLAAGGDPGRRRPVHAAHHRHHAAARQRHPRDRRHLPVHPRVRRARADADGRHGQAARPARGRHARHLLGDGVPVPHRLRRPPAAPGEPGAARGRDRHPRDPERLQGADARSGPDRAADPACRARPGRGAQGHVGGGARRQSAGSGGLGPRGRRLHRVRAAGRRLPRRRRADVSPARRRRRHRRPAAACLGRARHRAHDGAGPDLRPAHPGRHRHQGLVGGDQRPDHRGDGDRPAAPDAARRGPAPSAQRRPARRDQQPAPDLHHAEVGGLRAPHLHRDPPLRRPQRAGDAAHARDAGDTCCSPCPSIAMPSCAASSTCSTGPSKTVLPSPKTGRWRGFPIRRVWAGRSGCSR